MNSTSTLTIPGVALGLAVVFCGAGISVGEPIGTAWTYQGRLMDSNGPADGLYDLQFTLYGDLNVLIGNQIGSTIDINDANITEGYFTAELDFGSDIFSGDARWLQVAVRPGASSDPNAFVILRPLQEIKPTPYALSSSEVTGRVRTAGIYETFSLSWTPKDSNREWRSVAMSAEGSIQTAVVYEGQVYVSTDTGNTWIPKATPGKYCRWRSIAMSADGTIQTIVGADDPILISTDTGSTWTSTGTLPTDWRSVSMSADGTIQTALDNGGQIYVSTDTGNTWIPKGPNRYWRSVAMSADGSVQTAVADQIYVSTDTGNTWIPKETNRSWRSVAMSADGTIQTAVVPGEVTGGIYMSTDMGNTWTATEPKRQWYSVAVSADGTNQTAVVDDGQIYIHGICIGMGTKTPSANLDVRGMVRASGYAGAPWRSPRWFIFDGARDGTFEPDYAVHSYRIPFPVTVDKVLFSPSERSSHYTISFVLNVDGTEVATTEAIYVESDEPQIAYFSVPVNLPSGSILRISSVGISHPLMHVWLIGRTNEG